MVEVFVGRVARFWLLKSILDFLRRDLLDLLQAGAAAGKHNFANQEERGHGNYSEHHADVAHARCVFLVAE